MQLPDGFINHMQDIMGEEMFRKYVASLSENASVGIRINPLKWKKTPLNASLVPWCDTGWLLFERPNFTFDPLLHAGCYYVQEPSSMIIYHILRQYVKRDIRMLDLCASPGGKSTAALSALTNKSVLVCNEPIRKRAFVLAENISKWGANNVIVTASQPRDFTSLGISFDVILCDVPCSGEGMFRKKKEALDAWSVENIEYCSHLQRDIVSSAWSCLSEKGLLIYSTCALNTIENEENVQWFIDNLNAEILPIEVDACWNVTGSLLKGFKEKVYRFTPGIAKGEGLFVALLQKGKDRNSFSSSLPHGNVKKERQEIPLDCMDWLQQSSNFTLKKNQNKIFAIPNKVITLYDKISSSLNILTAGVTIGEIKGSDIIPDIALSLSTYLQNGVFPQIDLQYNEALEYLRCGTVQLPRDIPLGYVIITYEGKRLGFVKNLGHRCNNIYPKEWRIRSGYTPENQQIIKWSRG